MVCHAHRLMKMLNSSFAFRISVMDTHNYIFMGRYIKRRNRQQLRLFCDVRTKNSVAMSGLNHACFQTQS